MARSPFVWGQSGQKLTPEQVARQQQVALSLMGRGADFSPAKGGFAEALGRGLQGWASGRLNTLAREAEAEGMRGAEERWSQLGGALAPSEAPAIADRGFGISEPSPSPNAEGIRLGLISRGLPEHVADAFVMNFQDESGLNPGINETNPIVPGSRGGFGLAQWTGPRRRELEQFAAQRGTPVSDMDTQLDFLMTELSGPERAAAQKIMSSSDAPTAAAAIVNSFLRPAEEHRARREANYLGGSGGSYTQPSAQNVSALAEAMGDPWFAKQYGPVAEAMMGQQMQMQNAAYQQQLKQQDPAYMMGLEKAQLELDALRNPGPAAPVFEDGRWWDTNSATPQPLTDRAQDPTSLMQNLEAAGLKPGTPEYAQAMMDAALRPGVSVAVDSRANPAPATGYRNVYDESGNLIEQVPIEGGPVAREMEEQERKAELAKTNAANYARTVTQDIGVADEYLSSLGPMASADNVAGANLRVARSKVPGTAEYNMSKFVDSALSNVTLDTMNRMRESSPAGATGFGNMSERQMAVIQGVLGNWDPGLPVREQRLVLHRLGNFYLDVQLGTPEERAQAVRDGRMTAEENNEIQSLYYPETRDFQGNMLDGAEGSDDGPPEGISQDDWEYLTPEERALFR